VISRARRTTPTRISVWLIHLVQVIGEAARQVSREFTDTNTEVPWANIIGMRHKVVHDYLGVDEDIVWQVVTEDLPRLVAVLEPLVPPAS
jgi:uncharacterized protein with HEPN domain